MDVISTHTMKPAWVLVLVGALGLVGVMALRVYALVATEAIHTWDDDGYRHAAAVTAASTSVPAALRSVLLPEPRSMATVGFYPRTIGYHDGLVLGLKVFGSRDLERTDQSVNVALLAIQMLLVLYMARRSRFHWGESLCIATVYAASPMVFGLNRWVLTENHVFTAMLAVFAAALTLVTPRDVTGSTARRVAYSIARGALAGYVVGVFSTLREYAAPYYLAIALAAFAVLVVHRRVVTAGAYALVLAPFLRAAAVALPPVLEVARRTAENSRFFHPLGPWVLHSIGYFYGLPVAMATAWAMYEALRTSSRAMRPMEVEAAFDPLQRAALSAHQLMTLFVVGLVALAALQIVGLPHRVVRAGIPMIFMGIGLFFLVTADEASMQRFRRGATWTLAGAVILTWATLLRHTVFPEVPGALFRHHCTNLERVDYPFGLPRLPPGQTHTTCPL